MPHETKAIIEAITALVEAQGKQMTAQVEAQNKHMDGRFVELVNTVKQIEGENKAVNGMVMQVLSGGAMNPSQGMVEARVENLERRANEEDTRRKE